MPIARISVDTFTNPSSQHATQAEPDSFSNGSTVVVAIQTERFFDGGSSGIAFSASTDNGVTWVTGNRAVVVGDDRRSRGL